MKQLLENRMSKIAAQIIGAIALATTLVVPGRAVAQSGDFPGLKGGGNRTGHAVSVDGSSPGRAYPTWFAPQGQSQLTAANNVTVIDNTDFTYDDVVTAGVTTQDGSPRGVSLFSGGALWTAPATIFDAALPYIRPYSVLKNPGLGLRSPVYRMATTVASDPIDPSHPDVLPPATAGATATWTYRFFGTDALQTSPSAAYALYVHLPMGPTGSLAQQRYVVYTVKSGTRVWTDIIDTRAAGTGWVRIGNGGKPSNQVYGYNGVDPIEITLYNTLPRVRHIDGSRNDSYAGDSAPGFLVYADAAKAVPISGYNVSSPVAAYLDPTDTNTATVFQARNDLSISALGDAKTSAVGTLTAYYTSNGDTAKRGTARWSFSPIDNSPSTTVIDNTSLTKHETYANAWLSATTLPFYGGTDYMYTPAQVGVNQTADITLDSTISTDQYAVYIYSPGDQGTTHLSQHQFVSVTENGVEFDYYINMSVPGWHQVGTRRFNYSPTSSLKVTVGSMTTVAADETLNRIAYCDSIKLVGQADLGIKSTPVFYSGATLTAQGGSGTVTKNIVIFGDESGRLHCVDANGNADGTTTEYWTYPSTPDKNNPSWTDPNFTVGEDGVGGIAEMPTSFNLSSALITTVGTSTYLYVGGDNGRAYCIDVTGRGDFNPTTHTPGSTKRVWTYPATYGSKHPVPQSTLGGFIGSIGYADVGASGSPDQRIYLPAQQGRLYCVSADVSPTDPKTPVVKWTFPSLTNQTLGPISSTPALEFGNIYFGTEAATNTPRSSADKFVTDQGGFYCLNAANGPSNNGIDPVWWRAQDANGNLFDDFTSGPATSAYTELGDNVSAGGQVYALNANNLLYAFDALTGNQIWSTDEILGTSVGSLGFTKMSVFSNDGVEGGAFDPVVTVPVQDGRFGAYAAKLTDVNRRGSRRLWQYNPQGSVTSSIATANGFLFGADEDGYLYAFSDVRGTFDPNEFFPGSEVVVENNPAGDVFKKAKIKLISRDAYRKLVNDDPALSAERTYAYVKGNASNTNRASNAFEWGETLYAVIYDFPFITTAKTGSLVSPPSVSISINVNGRSIRAYPTESRQLDLAVVPQFSNAVPVFDPANRDSYIPHPALWFDSVNADPSYDPSFPGTDVLHNPPLDPVGFPYNLNYIPMDGYALVAFPIQGAGTQSLPPGPANITYSITTAALTGNVIQTFSPNPNVGFGRIAFSIANPLGVAMGLTSTGAPIDNLSIGNPTDPSAAENLQNGSRNVSGKNTSHLLASAGTGTHGQTSTGQMWVFDRSFMSLLRPNDPNSTDPQGLDMVRATRQDLAWQGGGYTVRKPFDPTLYPSFEDLPLNFPNTSIDYPNLRRENVNLTKDPNGNAENPILASSTLKAPMVLEAGKLRPLKDTDDPLTRTFRPTPVQIDVNVPRFQPSNTMVNDSGTLSPDIFLDSAGRTLAQGYLGRFNFFVDSDQSGQLNRALRKASRGFFISTAVAMDERLTVTTPQVDLGSLPGGSGLTTNGSTPAGVAIDNAPARFNESSLKYNPWNPAYAKQFGSFNVLNDGNVNMLNVRLAHGDARGATTYPWSFSSATNDNLAWLDGLNNLWSDLDPGFALGTNLNHIIPKPRVGDTVGVALTANPVRRPNNILGTTGFFGSLPDVLVPLTDASGTALLYPPVPPRVGITIPPGFPSGTYTQTMRVIEKNGSQQNLWESIGAAAAWETYSDPTFILGFNVRESRLTNRATQKSATMLENALDPNWPNNPPYGSPASRANSPFAFQNSQPSAFRNQSGAVYVAWATDRPGSATLGGSDASFGPASANTSGTTRISVGSMANQSTFTSGGFSTPVNPTAVPSPLRDLDFWSHGGGSWFNYGLVGFPNGSPDALFGGTIVPGTDSYYAPAFPATGDVNQFDPSVFYSNVYMAFVGRAQKQTASGREYDSRLFLTTVSSNASGSTTTGSIAALPSDTQSEKGRPSVVQTATGAMVFYPATSAGKTNINYVRYSASGFGPVSALNTGQGFDSVDAPSAVGRSYRGVDSTIYGAGPAQRAYFVDMTFAGRLRGRANQEVFVGQLAMPPAGTPDRLVEDASGNLTTSPWIFQNAQSERLVSEANGAFRARGVSWNRNSRIRLTMTRLNAAEVNILLDGYDASGVYTAANDTRQYDRDSGLISYATTIGGRVYFDPNLGIVRFGSAILDKTAELRLSYQPLFLRISTGNVGSYVQPTGLFDQRYISNESMWFTSANAPIATGSAITNDRFVYTYNRSAVGAGQGARPFMATMRFGIRLPHRIYVQNGVPAITVSGAVGPYQVDPANGRVYFTAADEDNSGVSVVYAAVNDANGAAVAGQVYPLPGTSVTIARISEQGEQQVPIEQASNESGMTTFLDPFSFLNQRRPPLMWMFWTSTRAGVPDLYFQTLAPQYAPVINRS